MPSSVFNKPDMENDSSSDFIGHNQNQMMGIGAPAHELRYEKSKKMENIQEESADVEMQV